LSETAGYTLYYSSLNQAAVYPTMQASFLGDEQALTTLLLKIIS